MKRIVISLALAATALAAKAQQDSTVVAPTAESLPLAATTDAPAATTITPAATTAATPAEQPATPLFGYISYNSMLEAMPQRAIVESKMKDMRKAYDAEVKRMEDEFNQKYEAFLDGRKDFPRTILLKRQTELQQLLEQGVAFKKQGQRDLAKATEEAMQPLRQQLTDAIATVAKRHGLALVINTDANAAPFIDPERSIDITTEVRALLK